MRSDLIMERECLFTLRLVEIWRGPGKHIHRNHSEGKWLGIDQKHYSIYWHGYSKILPREMGVWEPANLGIHLSIFGYRMCRNRLIFAGKLCDFVRCEMVRGIIESLPGAREKYQHQCLSVSHPLLKTVSKVCSTCLLWWPDTYPLDSRGRYIYGTRCQCRDTPNWDSSVSFFHFPFKTSLWWRVAIYICSCRKAGGFHLLSLCFPTTKQWMKVHGRRSYGGAQSSTVMFYLGRNVRYGNDEDLIAERVVSKCLYL